MIRAYALTEETKDRVWGAGYLARRDALEGLIRSCHRYCVAMRVADFRGEVPPVGKTKGGCCGPRGWTKTEMWMAKSEYELTLLALSPVEIMNEYGKIAKVEVLAAREAFENNRVDVVRMWSSSDYRWELARLVRDEEGVMWDLSGGSVEDLYDWAGSRFFLSDFLVDIRSKADKLIAEKEAARTALFEKSTEALRAWKEGRELPEGAIFKPGEFGTELWVNDTFVGAVGGC
jgi:hypothetical protein